MDNKKDTEISFFSQEPKNKLIFRLFEKDSHMLFIYKKIERVVSALFLVTNFLSDSEPLKWQIRGVATGTLSHTISSSINPVSRSEAGSFLSIDLVKIVSFLDIAYVAGLVSEMNFLVLKKELGNLIESINDNYSSDTSLVSNNVSISKDFFTVPQDQLKQNDTSEHEFVTPVFPGESRTPRSDLNPGYARGNNPTQKQKKYKGQNYIKDKYTFDENFAAQSSVSNKNTDDRERNIIELLKTKSNLTIKDFSSVIKGFSDKTIQRELLRLVKLNVLKKEGERRWSRYSLATQ